MKKRIIAAFISMVIVALSVLTVFSGCSGEEGVKEVDDREAFFAKTAGLYRDYSKNFDDSISVQVLKDGSFLIYYTFLNPDNDYRFNSCNEIICLKGSFQTVYEDDAISYHASISKLTPLICINMVITNGLSTNKIDFYPGNDLLDYLIHSGSSEDICSNDMFKFYFPGAPTTYIPAIRKVDDKAVIYSNDYYYPVFGNKYYDGNEYYEDIYDYDKNHDELLDYYLLYDNNIEHIFKPIETNYQIENGIWIDYTTEAPSVKVYKCKNNNIEVTRYSLSNNSLTKLESEGKNDDPYFYTALSNSIIMINDKEEKYLVIESTNDENKLKVSANNSNYSEIKKDYSLYYYDKLPEYDTLIKDAAKAKAEFSKNN